MTSHRGATDDRLAERAETEWPRQVAGSDAVV